MQQVTPEEYKKALDALFIKSIERPVSIVPGRYKTRAGERQFEATQGIKGNIVDVVGAGTKEGVIKRLATLHDKLSKGSK